jgi:hypothetical protein
MTLNGRAGPGFGSGDDVGSLLGKRGESNRGVLPAASAVSVHQKLQGRKIDGCIVWDQNLCIVFDAHSPISSTAIDYVKRLSIIFIHIIFVIPRLPPPNIRFLEGKVIPPIRGQGAGLIETRRSCSPTVPSCNENRNYAPWGLFEARCCSHSKLNILSFFHIQRLHILASTLSDFC